jgi:hypothetical protein
VGLTAKKKAVANATASQYETNSIRDFQFVTSTSINTQAALLAAYNRRRQHECE